MNPPRSNTTAGWKKYEGNPVMGGQYGTCFDVAMLRAEATYRLWLSWRPKRSLALVESQDSLHWNEPPQTVLGPRKDTGWEDDINRPGVVKRADGYHLWYTGQARGQSWIGYATSRDGVTWKRMSDKLVLRSCGSTMVRRSRRAADIESMGAWIPGFRCLQDNAGQIRCVLVRFPALLWDLEVVLLYSHYVDTSHITEWLVRKSGRFRFPTPAPRKTSQTP